MQQHSSPPSPRAATMASTDQSVSLSSSVSTLTSNVSTATTEETVVASEEDLAQTPSSSRNNISGSNTSLATSVSVSTNATITNSSLSSHQCAMPEDVVKSGYMRKLKTNRRKFFVLRRNHMLEKGHATLSYYDNEKKFRVNPESNSQLPRRTTLLKHCWNVHRKYDKTHRPVMAIYTREDMLATICDDETALAEWITAIRSILTQMSQFFSRPFREFDHIWQVNINRAGLGLSRNITGLHRITLASNVLYIHRVDPSVDNPDIYEFPLTSIRKCGHNSSTFFIELGRSALVGAGDLWMQTEDQTMALHIHEIVLSTMSRKRAQNEESAAAAAAGVPVLPRSNSTSSNHRPRSSSNSTDVSKSIQQTHNGSTQSISSVASSVTRSGSHSRRNSKQLPSPPQLSSTATTPTPTSATSAQQSQAVASAPANGTDGHGHVVPHHFSSGHPHHFHHGTSHNHHMYHYGHGRNGVPTSTQSPATSRERLYSGSWSRTTSECSNEDGSSGASSNAATTPSGQTNNFCETCLTNVSASNMHIWSANNNSPCPCLIQHSNMSLDYHSSTNGNNSSTHSSMDCIDSMFVPDHVDYHGGMPPTGGVLTLEPPISEEADGFNSDEYYQMMVPNSSENSKSNSNQSISSMTSSKSAAAHGHHPNQVYCVHLPHLQPIRSNSLSASDRRHTSPITSPKCSCSGCQQHYSNGGFFTLPTVPAGTDADYVPMTPLSQQSGNTEGTSQATTATSTGTTAEHADAATPNCENSQKQDANNRSMEEDSYLNMAPMSPETKTSSSSMSNATADTASSEFRLEKVRSYYGDQGCIIGNAMAHHHQPTPAAACGHQASLDDSIFNGLTRAYSTGSRPQPLAPSIAAQCTVAPKVAQPPPTSQNLRTRAYSTGSHGLSLNAFRLKSRRQGKQQQAQQLASATSFEGETIASSSSSSSLAEIEASNLVGASDSAKNNKASSAPILSPLIQQRTRSATLGSRPTPANQHMMHHAGKMSHPHLASVSQSYNELESDMMEIDYSRKSRSRMSQMGNSDIILSSFEEELIREAKKAPSRSRLNSTSGPSGSEAIFAVLKSGGSTSLDGSTALQPGLANGRKRSDSTSAISNFFGPHRPHGHGGHHVTFRTGSTFDHLVASFRHSLNIQPSTSTSTSEGSSKAANSSTETGEEECYMMTSPTGGHDRSTPSSTPTSKKSSESLSSAASLTPVKSESKGLAASLTSIIRKSAKVGSNEKLRQPTPALEMTVLSAPQEYTVMSPLGSTVATKSPETTTLHKETAITNESMEVDALSKKLEEKAITLKQQAEAPIYSSRYDSDEEASPYVMMTPFEATSGRKSAPSSSSNSQKKQKTTEKKTSAMRSLINSLGSKSSASSSSPADQTNNTPRKKSSTFSGRLLLSRSNSNHSEAKRKKNSKSESSSTLPPPPNCSADHAVTNGTVTTMSALAS